MTLRLQTLGQSDKSASFTFVMETGESRLGRLG